MYTWPERSIRSSSKTADTEVADRDFPQGTFRGGVVWAELGSG